MHSLHAAISKDSNIAVVQVSTTQSHDYHVTPTAAHMSGIRSGESHDASDAASNGLLGDKGKVLNVPRTMEMAEGEGERGREGRERGYGERMGRGYGRDGRD